MVYGQKPKYYSSARREIAVHAGKFPNVIHRSYVRQVEGKSSTTRAMSGIRNILISMENIKIRVEISNI